MFKIITTAPVTDPLDKHQMDHQYITHNQVSNMQLKSVCGQFDPPLTSFFYFLADIKVFSFFKHLLLVSVYVIEHNN